MDSREAFNNIFGVIEYSGNRRVVPTTMYVYAK